MKINYMPFVRIIACKLLLFYGIRLIIIVKHSLYKLRRGWEMGRGVDKVENFSHESAAFNGSLFMRNFPASAYWRNLLIFIFLNLR